MDVASLVAIDMHTHVHRSVTAPPGGGPEAHGAAAGTDDHLAAMARYFKTDAVAFTVDDLAAYYRERKMAAVTFMVDNASEAPNPARATNEEIAERATANDDVIIPFASIDPHRGAAGVERARRLIEEHGVKGFKFHPSSQGFYPNDRELAYPLYEVIEAAGLPALFHTGQTGAGAGTRGGGGIRLGYSNPIYLDDVAVDFPDMPIIMAHPSFPWQDEALSVATHKPQVYIDLSGWSPKYFPPQLIQYANSLLQDKVLFGTDYPLLTPERWLRDFDSLDFKPEARAKILKANAAGVLGLD